MFIVSFLNLTTNFAYTQDLVGTSLIGRLKI